MADTVKKSRIVSEENYSNFDVIEDSSDSLQSIINSEFNERLKTCMTPTITVLNEPPDLTNSNHNFIENNPKDSEETTAKDRFLSGEENLPVKDRMFLSTDSALLLFTQTVVQSPMLTPTDENYDFLQALTCQNSAETNNTNVDFIDVDEVVDVDEVDEVDDEVVQVVQSSESTHVETSQKKKKSKKQKKDSEKENISVTDFSADDISHVSVKNLRAKSMSDIHRDDVTLENVFSNVSVKYLRECFDNLTNKNTNLTLQTQISASKIDFKPYVTTSERIKQLKSSFSKFDALSKKTVLHVRSSDAGKAQEKFNGTSTETSSCKQCQKQVFQMEQIKAEKSIWHKNCFRCNECNKQLNVDTYQSNEGVLYCKPHFRALFTPKAVEDEPQPTSDKPDLGLDELQNLNVKERFQVFEHHDSLENSLERTPSQVNVKRSPSILSKLAKFQQKGMDIGVADDSLNGVTVEESDSESAEEGDELDCEDPNLIRARRAAAQREIPLHFNNMSEVMSKWESGNQVTKEERREERKQEIQSIRSRLFMGKQGKMKELYQQAVLDSSSGVNVKKSPLDTELCEGAKTLKEKFERGEALTPSEEKQLLDQDEEKGVFEAGISKKSRSIFLELDANASKAPQLAPLSPSRSGAEVRRAREAFMQRQASEDTVRATDHVDDVQAPTQDISNKFKFFETYKEKEKPRKAFRFTPPREGQVKLPSPERDIYRDPDIIRSEDQTSDDSHLAKKTHTATKMLNIFRQMEENLQKKEEPQGPKPLKRFTPPPEGESQRNDSGSEEGVSDEEDEYEEDEPDKAVDEDLIEAQKAARAKHLRAKFEKWEAHEIQREQNNSSVNLAQEIGEGDSQIESARSLRARFESMRETTTEKERQPRIKVNRFVDQTNNAEICKSCLGRVYPLEKVSCHNNIYHKNCFRCKECNAILRMDSYSYNQGLLYCLPHFKRLFAVKGNYESGFGLDQHKEKWNITA